MDDTSPSPSADAGTTPDADGEEVPAGLQMKDPTDTEHPVGEDQAAENDATESPS